jgi:hypothetical protein
MEDISIPSCFVSLLDLASEENLNLISNDQLNDLYIVKDNVKDDVIM